MRRKKEIEDKKQLNRNALSKDPESKRLGGVSAADLVKQSKEEHREQQELLEQEQQLAGNDLPQNLQGSPRQTQRAQSNRSNSFTGRTAEKISNATDKIDNWSQRNLSNVPRMPNESIVPRQQKIAEIKKMKEKGDQRQKAIKELQAAKKAIKDKVNMAKAAGKKAASVAASKGKQVAAKFVQVAVSQLARIVIALALANLTYIALAIGIIVLIVVIVGAIDYICADTVLGKIICSLL